VEPDQNGWGQPNQLKDFNVDKPESLDLHGDWKKLRLPLCEPALSQPHCHDRTLVHWIKIND